jgi:membrane fusion protein (multidrug efflux system)
VLEIFVDNTERVEAGQLLVRLDPTDAAVALEKAESELAAAVRQVVSQIAQRGRLSALIEARERELALAEAEFERRAGLRAGQSVTAEELERYRNQAAVSAANLRAARHELEVTERLLGPTTVPDNPQVLLAAARLKEAWLAWRRCEVRSPSAGTVAKRSVQVGHQVDPFTPLLAVIPGDQLWVEANLKESQLGRVRPGQRVLVRADMYGSRHEYRGVVAGLSAGTGSVFSLLPPENATGNWIKVVQRVPVRIVIDPADLAAAPLLLGLSLHTRIDVLGDPADVPPPAEGADYRAWPEDWGAEELAGRIGAIIEANMAAGMAAGTAAGTASGEGSGESASGARGQGGQEQVGQEQGGQGQGGQGSVPAAAPGSAPDPEAVP